MPIAPPPPPHLGETLSLPARKVWAKSDQRDGGRSGAWLPLWRHMADSGAVAGLLWDHWLPRQVRQLVAEALPGGEEHARLLAVWLATVHDVGKATPAFACQVEDLASAMQDSGLVMPTRRLLADRSTAPHGLAGQVLLDEWLEQRWEFPKPARGQFTVVVGGHHGVPPDAEQVRLLRGRSELLRTRGTSEALWRGVQRELLDAAAAASGVTELLPAWRDVRLPQPVQVLLSATVIVADWIASNPDLFPYFPEAQEQTSAERVEAAWRRLELPTAWRAVDPPREAEAHYGARFALPPGAGVRPVQATAVQLVRELPEPGLLIVEAPMGEGKTEAALAVAEVFAARSGAGGCFFALPTRATGDAMFPRLKKWLDRLPDEDRDRGAHSVFLAHAKSALNPHYTALMKAPSRPLELALDEVGTSREGRDVSHTAELVAHQWLRGRKKGMLSSFVAGTIDQLLFGALKTRHLALRHLALAGKVVVIDEAHAYDAYMDTYLDGALAWLGAYRVPVVVLSATLPAARRRELARAYAGAQAYPDASNTDGTTHAYPLLTAVAPGGTAIERAPAASGRAADVLVEALADAPEALADRLAVELDAGGCALVVRNTVDRVRETAAVLRGRFGADAVTVAHARFVDLDRAAKDTDLRERFGPPEDCAERRPGTAHIVVASQVAEQSLDVDFDLLVTDLAPVDLVLQRMGRLHRHQRERPPRLRTARCLITGVEPEGGGVEWTAADGPPPTPVRGSAAVYGAWPLLRAAAVLRPHLDDVRPVRLPADISPLVQQAYGAVPQGSASWQDALAAAEKADEARRTEQQDKAGKYRLTAPKPPGRSLLGWIDAGVGDVDDTPAGRQQVRDAEESVEVLVVQRTADGTLRTLPHLPPDQRDRERGGLELPTATPPDPHRARTVAGSALRLPHHFCYATADRAVAELEELYVDAWQGRDCHWLAGQLILALDEDCQCSLAGFELRYSPDDGLEVTRAP
ncbi:CRISPR-associated helicase Cas3' [Streptomyces xiaopingdaonensis]|uniref:CRISPR-associated helicase Cas3' n=1 Tax=Streptomyces xiaopingdaonensis TaxID=1565415 RepID=UPI000304015A|nr:CRISPR-associated helicase Cas3' [Streptomyces xiaopingdaonensis]